MPGTTERRLAQAATNAGARVLCDGDECLSGVSGAWEVVGKGDFVMVKHPLDARWKAAGVISVTHGGHSNAEFGLRLLETDALVERIASDGIRWVLPASRHDVLAAGLAAQRRWKVRGQSPWTKMRAKLPIPAKPDAAVSPLLHSSATEPATTAKRGQERRAQQQILRRVQQAEAASCAASKAEATPSAASVGWMSQAPSLGPVWGLGIAKPTCLHRSAPESAGAARTASESGGEAGKASGWRAKAAARKAARTDAAATLSPKERQNDNVCSQATS
jgi:hypothetical protein